MTFILDMSSGKKYAGEEFGCPKQRTERSQQPDINRDDNYPTLQLETIESANSYRQRSSGLPGIAIASSLVAIED